MAKARNINPGDWTPRRKVTFVEDAAMWNPGFESCVAIHWERGTKSGVMRRRHDADVKRIYKPKGKS